MRQKAIALLSGGLDSSIATLLAQDKFDVVESVTFNYGQRSAINETAAADKIRHHMQIPSHHSIRIDLYKELRTQSTLLNKEYNLPKLNISSLDNTEKTQDSAAKVWVPNRNGLLINYIATIAEAKSVDFVIVGFNAEEALTFPDNSADFLHTINNALFYSTKNKVEVICPTIDMTKTEIIKIGMEKSFPFKLLWSCYSDGRKMCGLCESCLRLKRAFNDHHTDRNPYEDLFTSY